ncbi:MAG: IS1595 family transposase [Alphaproteobacteria bacterium]
MKPSDKIFHDETAARRYLEELRWPDGPYCPFCGVTDRVKSLPAKGSMGPGWYHCQDCRKKFTVRVGTVYERSKVPLHQWLFATWLMASSKKGVSAKQIERMLGVSYKTAWFMAHRIREAMKPSPHSFLGGPGKTIEADETYVGGKETNRHKNKRGNKASAYGKKPVVSLVERDGRVRSVHVPNVTGKTVRLVLKENASRKSHLMTDESGVYRYIGKQYASHGKVNHKRDEYVRGDAHVNSAENYFSILKRGINGVYHAVSEQHLQRYLHEFDFRYTNREGRGVDDEARTVKALRGIEGKRLTYRRSDDRANV